MELPVTEDVLNSLTEGQKDCLRLVNDHLTSKEIARILQISPFTVDQRLDAAKKKMGVSSRREAAKIFAEAGDRTIYQQTIYQNGSFSSEMDGPNNIEPSNRVAQTFKAFSQLMPVPPIGGERHNLSKKEIIRQSISIAFVGSIAVIIITIFLIGVMRLFN